MSVRQHLIQQVAVIVAQNHKGGQYSARRVFGERAAD
jgi:hypothetical protein